MGARRELFHEKAGYRGGEWFCFIRKILDNKYHAVCRCRKLFCCRIFNINNFIGMKKTFLLVTVVSSKQGKLFL